MRYLIIALFFTSELLAAPSKNYGLKVGEKAPDIALSDIDGKKFSLANEVKKGPVVAIFYRGGWCPFCNTQLRSLESKVMPKLKKLGASLIAISVDKVDEGLKSKQKDSFSFRIFSDSKAEILQRYKIAYKVQDELVSTYKTKHGIDLEKSSGEKHHLIAIPSAYVINQAGVITFAFVDENYKNRAPETEIINAVEKLLKKNK